MRSAAIFICLTLFACGDGPPDERAGATTFTPAASGAAVNRVIIEGVADAAVAEGEVVVAIRVEAIERLHGGTLVMTYPDSVISLVEVVPGELVAGGVLVTTLGTGEEVAGELAIGFVLAPSTASAASGTLARVKLSVSGGASGQVGRGSVCDGS